VVIETDGSLDMLIQGGHLLNRYRINPNVAG
jgi:hypothetical protein